MKNWKFSKRIRTAAYTSSNILMVRGHKNANGNEDTMVVGIDAIAQAIMRLCDELRCRRNRTWRIECFLYDFSPAAATIYYRSKNQEKIWKVKFSATMPLMQDVYSLMLTGRTI